MQGSSVVSNYSPIGRVRTNPHQNEHKIKTTFIWNFFLINGFKNGYPRSLLVINTTSSMDIKSVTILTFHLDLMSYQFSAN